MVQPYNVLLLGLLSLLVTACASWPDPEVDRTRPGNPPRWADKTKPPPLSRALTVGFQRFACMPTITDEQVCFYAEVTQADYADVESATYGGMVGVTNDYDLFMKYRTLTTGALSETGRVPCLLGTIRGQFTLADDVHLSSCNEHYDTTVFRVGVDIYDNGGIQSGTPDGARIYFCLRLDGLSKDQKRVRIIFDSPDIDGFNISLNEIKERSRRVVTNARHVRHERAIGVGGLDVWYTVTNGAGVELLDGPSWTEQDGKVIRFCEYRAGMLNGFWYMAHESQVLWDGDPPTGITERRYYRMDMPEGVWTWTAANGQVVAQTRFSHGRAIEPPRNWYMTGEPQSEACYAGDLIVSVCYFKSGKVQFRGAYNWKSGKKQGVHETWWENGQLRDWREYSNGVMVKPMKQWDRNGKQTVGPK